MNNELQLLTPHLPATPLPWQGGGLGAPAAPAETTAVQKVHRLLRGRYLLAVVLGLLGAAAGAAGGFLSQKPAYRSDGLLEINPIVPKSMEQDKVMVMSSTYVQSQMAKLRSEQVVRAALEDPEWKKVRPYTGPVKKEDIARFGTNLTVAIPPRSSTFIQISWSDNAPDAQKVAPVAVGSVLRAYKNKFSSKDNNELEDRIKYWTKKRAEYDQEIDRLRRSIETLSKEFGDDPTVIHSRTENLIAEEKKLRESRENLAQAEKDLQAATAGTQKFLPEDWARVDKTMESRVALRDEWKVKINSIQTQLAPNHPAVVRAKLDLQAVEQAVTERAQELSSRFLIRWKEDGTGGVLIPKDLARLREAIDRAAQLCEQESKNIQELRFEAQKIATYRDEINQIKTKITVADDQLSELSFQKDFLGPGRIREISTGDIAVLDKDKRPVFAAIGFMGGAALPIGLLLLVGLLDSRYRFSDETAPSTSGLTLLGILPNLPDRLSDPEQAAIAAHCVHQIRTMLQINGGMEDRRVFAVTSASPGDGKTSLTLALGLSYAACGTRTLLIDCDLIGAGLTSRMNVSSAEGVLEAIANRGLLPYVRQTDVADVALLPVGSAGNLHASTLSPAALRRLIEEAEKHFETILIDTGPILGSIEASLVCAAADAVILTVARGQQRPMVEKSMGHLVAIGARLAGVVFNRAQASDFERSISGVSMRSVGVHGPRTPGSSRLGPVARAVAGSDHDDGPAMG